MCAASTRSGVGCKPRHCGCSESAFLVLSMASQVSSQHSASPWLSHLVQDLELWLSREVVPDGHLLITRAGKTVQELQIKTSLSAPEMKSAVQRVLRRLV